MQPAPQNNQLMSKHGVLSLKPQRRFEWRGQARLLVRKALFNEMRGLGPP
jgi:hypothetical protein